MKNCIIASTSTIHGSQPLKYLLDPLRELYKNTKEVIFIPYARPGGISHNEYTNNVSKAFAKIDKDALSALLKDRAKLAKVLTYHVVPGNLEAKDVVKKSSAKTVEGSKVPIVSNKDGVKVGGAKVLKTDILCSNGVVHVIDTVIMPPAK